MKDHFFSTKDFSVIQGSHRNYSETEHKRWIFLKSEEIVVVDILLSEKDTINQYQQLFNLAPNLSAHKQTTSEIAVKNGNQTVMRWSNRSVQPS